MSQAPEANEVHEVNETSERRLHASAWMYTLVIGSLTFCGTLYSLFVDRSIATGPMFQINCVYAGVCWFLALIGTIVQSPVMKWLGIVFGSIGIGMILASPILAQL